MSGQVPHGISAAINRQKAGGADTDGAAGIAAAGVGKRTGQSPGSDRSGTGADRGTAAVGCSAPESGRCGENVS